MPTNNELKLTATKLAEKLPGVDLELDKLTNVELSELVSDLKAKVRDAQITSQADQDVQIEKNAAAERQEEEDREPGFVVAPGKSVIGRRGIIGEGESLTPDNLACDEEGFNKLLDMGIFVRR